MLILVDLVGLPAGWPTLACSHAGLLYIAVYQKAAAANTVYSIMQLNREVPSSKNADKHGCMPKLAENWFSTLNVDLRVSAESDCGQAPGACKPFLFFI